MTIEAAPQPDNFTANFTIKVTGLRTATVGNLQDVVKQVEWTMIGTEGTQTFELPQVTTVPDPDTPQFVPLQNLTEAQVVSWIEAHETRLPGIRAHIQLVLDREVSKAALATAQMPWALAQGPAPAPGV